MLLQKTKKEKIKRSYAILIWKMAARKINSEKIEVILMTYGSPANLDEVPTFLKNVYGGKDPTPEVIQEFRRRYDLIGGSPLIKITQQQAAALEALLNSQNPGGQIFKVAAGMRFSHPFISEVVTKLAQDTNQIIGIIMSPQYSPIIMQGYIKNLEDAIVKLHKKSLKCTVAPDWHLEPYFLQAVAQRVQQALAKISPNSQNQVPILFSAHSMPKRVVENEPDYINSLKETAAEVAKILKLPDKDWMFCYQSAGHTKEDWLKPDFADIMPELSKKGYTQVLIAPIQFLADHLEILYDIEIGARQQAEDNGIQFFRTESLNTSPLFIKALAEVVGKTLIELKSLAHI